MQGNARIIELLNEQLTSELTAINQYFLHARMHQNWALTELASHTRAESIEEMSHAEALADRILFLEGLPNFQRLFPLRIGQDVKEQLENDMAIELEVLERLQPAIREMRQAGDATSARLFEKILEDEEHHIDYLETQLELIEKLGLPLYLARHVSPPGG